jgi:uncharacterized damage-inducible protein DinB
MANGDRLVDALQRAHDGEPWHGPSRADVLADVTAQEAAYAPGGDVHSVWELVLHMRSWTEEVLRRANGGTPGEPVKGDWPAVPATRDDNAWREALRSLDAAHEELVAFVTALSDEHRASRVADRPGEAPGTGITQRAMIRSLAEHDVYHTGQLAVLKRIARAALADSSPTTRS